MKSMQEEGLRLIREAEGILRRDARGALDDKDFKAIAEIYEVEISCAVR